MIKGAIFDMDGLMFDTERLANEGWLEAAKKLDYPITPEIIDKIRGTNIKYSKQLFLDELGEKVNYDLAREVRTKYVNDKIESEGMVIKEGLFDLLDYLKSNKVKIAVATSTHKIQAEVYLKKGKVYEYFDVHVYGDMITKGKPDPEIFLLAVEKLGLKPEDCVVFEDSPHGIEAGYKAGCKVIGVPDMTELNEDTLKKVLACCKNLKEAIEIINK